MKKGALPLPGEPPRNTRCTALDTMLVFAQSPDRPPVPLIADLRYDTADPYAVCLVLHIDKARTVPWFFARCLLTDGIVRPVGEGDVIASPVTVRGAASVRVTLRSPSSSVDVHLPLRALRSFLRKTDAMVRPGTEHLHLDLDDLTHRLTDGS